MRRADPSPDGDGAPLPTYADSDVGSSPRSVGGQPGRWDDSAFPRVKLMCSYGGRIFPRPHDNQLRYVGGDSRIAVVSRNITFSELISKLSRMFGSSVVIKYQLPYEDLDALISVTSDEDLENMMEEYDRLQSIAHQNVGVRPSAPARLRLFLFASRLERETASLSDVMENKHSREHWFFDILNGAPVPLRVRSETSSIVSETPDYTSQGNTDTLEEWADAASYGNSLISIGEQFTDHKQGDPVSPAALFGSLVQQVTLSEPLSVPVSPSLFKPKSTGMGSSSSALPAVFSVITSIADAVSYDLPAKPMEVDGSIDSLTCKIGLGSADSGGSVPEQKKHVDSETLLSSDKNILNSSVGGAEQLLPAGLMDDDDASQKYAAKGSFDNASESSETAVFDAGLHQVMQKASETFKGDMVSETAVLTGQPIFDDELFPIHILARKLNAMQIEEGALSPKIMSPSSTSPASAPLMPPTSLKREQVVPRFGLDEKSKHHAFPVSPRAGAHVSSEDKVVQQILPASALNVMPAPKGIVDDTLLRLTPPSLDHLLSSQIAPQQPSAVVTREDMVPPQIVCASPTRDTESIHKLQSSTVTTPSVVPPSFVPAPVQQEKAPASGPSYFYQQPSSHGLEVPYSAVTQLTQAPIQLPFSLQAASPVMGMVSKPSPPVAVPVRPANVVPASRPAIGMSRPQSPPIAVPQHAPPLMAQIRTTTTSLPPQGPSNLVSNVNQLDTSRGTAAVSSTAVPTVSATIITTGGEGIAVRGAPYPQGDNVNIQRQGGDPMQGQRLAAMAPQLGTQFNAANISVPPASGMPTRFQAVGHPLQQVVEGVPMQQAALTGIIADTKVPSAMMRGGPSPSSRPLNIPAGQYSYASTTPQAPAGLGGSPRYNVSSSVILGVPASSSELSPFAGANPFADGFQGASAYPDASEGLTADQNLRYPMR